MSIQHQIHVPRFTLASPFLLSVFFNEMTKNAKVAGKKKGLER
jgi:hypothetical protein